MELPTYYHMLSISTPYYQVYETRKMLLSWHRQIAVTYLDHTRISAIRLESQEKLASTATNPFVHKSKQLLVVYIYYTLQGRILIMK